MDNSNFELHPFLSERESLIHHFHNKTILITGGTGFFGKSILDTFLRAKNQVGIICSIIVLSRDPDRFLSENTHFSNWLELSFLKGDILTFSNRNLQVDYIIHAATEASVQLNREQPRLMYETCIRGSEAICRFAENQKELKGILFTSSGAVYGTQPQDLGHLAESYFPLSLPTIEQNAYMIGKIDSEKYFIDFSEKTRIPVKIARCFAFVGPYLPLDTHFAIGNFINDIIHKRDIVIKGDGTTVRSYLYANDLVEWLLTILVNGKSGLPYNVGSEDAFNMRELAVKLCELYPERSYKILGSANPDAKINRYVPSTARARVELGLQQRISMDKAVKATVDFYSK